MIYTDHEDAYYLPSVDGENERTKDFFKNGYYKNGSKLPGFLNWWVYKKIAKRYKVKGGINKGNAKIWVLPVLLETDGKIDGEFYEEHGDLFFKGKQEINIQYWFMTPNKLGELKLFCKKVLRKFKRAKKPPPDTLLGV